MNKELMTQLFMTKDSWTPLVIRLTIALVILPHVLQKLFGWFNGPGLSGEMKFMTRVVHMSPLLAVTAITIECAGCFMLLAGIGTRLAAAAIFLLFIGIIARVHFKNGYFMNFFGKLPAGQEGYEFHLLVLGLCIASILEGGGKWSLDKLLYGQ
jgi:putative oxidoreductase